jgi:hypothetical protein
MEGVSRVATEGRKESRMDPDVSPTSVPQAPDSPSTTSRACFGILSSEPTTRPGQNPVPTASKTLPDPVPNSFPPTSRARFVRSLFGSELTPEWHRVYSLHNSLPTTPPRSTACLE